MTKHAFKFLIGAGIMVLIGLGVLYVLPFFDGQYKSTQELPQKAGNIRN